MDFSTIIWYNADTASGIERRSDIRTADTDRRVKTKELPMKSKRNRAVLLVLCACLLSGGCSTPQSNTPGTGMSTEESSMSDTVTETDRETEAEAAEGYIPHAEQVDFSRFDETILKQTFPAAVDTEVSLCAEGVLMTASGSSNDPQVTFNISDMYRAAGYAKTAAGSYVPFTPENVKTIVLKVKCSESGLAELFYATGSLTTATAGCSVSGSYIGGDGWWYVMLDLSAQRNGQYVERFNNGCRLDWSTDVRKGDTFILGEMLFFSNRSEGKAYVDSRNKISAATIGKTGYGDDMPAEGLEAGYYVCLYQNKLGTDDAGVSATFGTGSLEEAKSFCDKKKQLGYRVADEKGNVVYAPYTLLQCDILREAKYVTTYARENHFTYGDAPINPAINNRAKKVSCDRLVCWVMYRVGFTDQPVTQGVVVSAMHTWAKENGFIEITDKNDLQPGDIVLVKPNSSGTYALHTFLFAGAARQKGMYYRYDHGSDTRIMSYQPNVQELELDGAPFWRAYRPVASAENNVYYDRYYAG